MKNIFTLLVILICVVCCLPPAANAAAKVGDVIEFGDWNWRVLDVQDGKLLIITEQIINTDSYNTERTSITWEKCTLRKYLNGEFYAKFSKEEQGLIAETRISNPDNMWYEYGKGGNNTIDKVFLLSLEEVLRYFGDSGDYVNKNRNKQEGYYPKDKWVPSAIGVGFSDAYDNNRMAMYENEPHSWWLRSPGGLDDRAAMISEGGAVFVNGMFVADGVVGIRPVLWMKH